MPGPSSTMTAGHDTCRQANPQSQRDSSARHQGHRDGDQEEPAPVARPAHTAAEDMISVCGRHRAAAGPRGPQAGEALMVFVLADLAAGEPLGEQPLRFGCWRSSGFTGRGTATGPAPRRRRPGPPGGRTGGTPVRRPPGDPGRARGWPAAGAGRPGPDHPGPDQPHGQRPGRHPRGRHRDRPGPRGRAASRSLGHRYRRRAGRRRPRAGVRAVLPGPRGSRAAPPARASDSSSPATSPVPTAARSPPPHPGPGAAPPSSSPSLPHDCPGRQ